MDDETVEHLLGIGALEIAYTDKENNNVYRFTEDARSLAPEIYKDYLKDFNNSIFSLWMKGVVDVVFDENGDPLIGMIYNKDREKVIKDLDEDDLEVLEEISKSWDEKER